MGMKYIPMRKSKPCYFTLQNLWNNIKLHNLSHHQIMIKILNKKKTKWWNGAEDKEFK